MAELPRPALPTGTLDLDGTRVEYRSLSRSQALQLNGYRGREDEAEDFIVSCGTGLTMDEAHAWRDAVSFEIAGQLVEAIIDISGLSESVGKA